MRLEPVVCAKECRNACQPRLFSRAARGGLSALVSLPSASVSERCVLSCTSLLVCSCNRVTIKQVKEHSSDCAAQPRTFCIFAAKGSATSTYAGLGDSDGAAAAAAAIGPGAVPP